MADVLWNPNLLAVCAAGIGGCAVGLVGLTVRAVPRWLLPTYVGALSALAVAAAVVGQSPGLWLPPLLVAAAGGLLAALRCPAVARAGRWVVRQSADRRLQGAAVLVFGLGFALWRTHAAVQEATVEEMVPQAAPTPIPLPLEALPTPARTDCGRAVPLFASLNSMVEDAAFSESELTLIKHWGDSLQILRLEAAGSHSNCHGWIFTGGRHRVKCEDVPAILEDNEYQRVDAPQAQDLVIYFGPRGEVLHSGLVHSAAPSGRILIESKWGSLGVFLHPLTAQPYGTTYAFYHSHRAGHRLLGLGD